LLILAKILNISFLFKDTKKTVLLKNRLFCNEKELLVVFSFCRHYPKKCV